MSDSREYMLDVDLNELNEPYKLAKWIQILPKYRVYFLNNTTKTKNNSMIDHSTNCQLLSEFFYQIQYCGKHIKCNFTEDNFKELLDIMHTHKENSKYNYNDYIWIWNIIKQAQNAKKNKSQKPNTSLKWIHTNWKRFEIMEQNESKSKSKSRSMDAFEPYESKEFQKSESKEKDIETATIIQINNSENIASNKVVDYKEEETRNSNSSKHDSNNNLTTLTRSDDIDSNIEESRSEIGYDQQIEDEEQAMLVKESVPKNRIRLETDSVDIDDSNNNMNIQEFTNINEQKAKRTRTKGNDRYESIQEVDNASSGGGSSEHTQSEPTPPKQEKGCSCLCIVL